MLEEGNAIDVSAGPVSQTWTRKMKGPSNRQGGGPFPYLAIAFGVTVPDLGSFRGTCPTGGVVVRPHVISRGPAFPEPAFADEREYRPLMSSQQPSIQPRSEILSHIAR